MIDLFYAPTPNGWKIAIFLEEAGLAYTVRPVNIGRGEQFAPDFLALRPNNRIPAIVDNDPADSGPPVSIFESGAILLYLAEKTGQFLPTDLRGRTATQEWLMWQMGGLGPMLGQNGHFRLYAPEPIPYAIDRYSREAERLYGVLDRRLAATGAHVAGEAFTVADMAIFPWVVTHKAQGLSLDDYPAVKTWFARVRARPGVQAGMSVGRATRPAEMDAETRRNLFGQGQPAPETR
jgi:GST-like protein